MRVRWTTDAADDLERICDYIAETSPDSARRVARTIIEGIASLHTLPNRGRLGRVEGTREFVFAPLPFVAVYEVHDEVHVLRILHGRPTVATLDAHEIAIELLSGLDVAKPHLVSGSHLFRDAPSSQLIGRTIFRTEAQR